MRTLAIAATHSGAGKTTVTMALIAALRARGVRVRAFKVGPDFIDAAHLARISGADCHNLDGWMLGRDLCRGILARAAADCDIALIEGMMGLYDGARGDNESGSTAEMAKWLDAPVVLVVDAAAAARSVAATVLGFHQFDRGLNLAGVIFNRVGGPGHATYLRQAMRSVPAVRIAGSCVAAPQLHIPERHLGLTLPDECSTPRPEALAAWAEINLDLDALLSLAAEFAPLPQFAPRPTPARPRPRLGLARDPAFCFYYPDNLERLRAAGIELVEFSPLTGSSLPPRLAGIYLGGGYPELHAPALGANTAMRAAVARFAAADGFIYAECGGLMYLAESLTTVAGKSFAMAGVLPLAVEMQPRLSAIGYREVEPQALGLPQGTRARGHEFHHSRIASTHSAGHPAHTVIASDGSRRPEGWVQGETVASYIHLHFASCPDLAPTLAARLRQRRMERAVR